MMEPRVVMGTPSAGVLQTMVVTPGYVSTPKCLYGLAAGLSMVQPRWVTDSVAADRRLEPAAYAVEGAEGAHARPPVHIPPPKP